MACQRISRTAAGLVTHYPIYRLTGWLAGRFGRKKVFLISIVGFTVASALCGMAQSLPEIVLFRLLQGMSGAALVPLSQAVLFDINKPEDFGKAMALSAGSRSAISAARTSYVQALETSETSETEPERSQDRPRKRGEPASSGASERCSG